MHRSTLQKQLFRQYVYKFPSNLLTACIQTAPGLGKNF